MVLSEARAIFARLISRYGFITFDSQEDATRVQEQVRKQADCLPIHLNSVSNIRRSGCRGYHGNVPDFSSFWRAFS